MKKRVWISRSRQMGKYYRLHNEEPEWVDGYWMSPGWDLGICSPAAAAFLGAHLEPGECITIETRA